MSHICPYETTTKKKDFCPFDEGRKSQNKWENVYWEGGAGSKNYKYELIFDHMFGSKLWIPLSVMPRLMPLGTKRRRYSLLKLRFGSDAKSKEMYHKEKLSGN